MAVVERVDTCGYKTILREWRGVTHGTIAALFILFALLVYSGTETFV